MATLTMQRRLRAALAPLNLTVGLFGGPCPSGWYVAWRDERETANGPFNSALEAVAWGIARHAKADDKHKAEWLEARKRERAQAWRDVQACYAGATESDVSEPHPIDIWDLTPGA